jgi:cytochrome c oxidase subunit 2
MRKVTLAAGAALMAAAPAFAQSRYNLPPPVTPVAREIYDLHIEMMWVCVGIFVVVFGVMFYAIWKHRKSVGHVASQFHESTTVEIVWTVVPLLILIVMAIPATRVLLQLKDTSNPDITIKATGYQWKWGYDYLDGEGQGISLLSMLSTTRDEIEGNAPKSENYLLEVDTPITVPIGKKVRILTTADDVIHSWWVPAFGIKQDAIPGYVRDTWFKAEKEGVYRGQCAELCGKEHGFMPIVVNVVSQQAYTEWVAEQKKKAAGQTAEGAKTWTKPALLARGEQVYDHVCAACHQVNGQGVPHAFPSLDGSQVVLGPPKQQVKLVLSGRRGMFTAESQMPSQAMLSDADLAAAITYTRNAWTNKAADDVVQPREVKAARN